MERRSDEGTKSSEPEASAALELQPQERCGPDGPPSAWRRRPGAESQSGPARGRPTPSVSKRPKGPFGETAAGEGQRGALVAWSFGRLGHGRPAGAGCLGGLEEAQRGSWLGSGRARRSWFGRWGAEVELRRSPAGAGVWFGAWRRSSPLIRLQAELGKLRPMLLYSSVIFLYKQMLTNN